MTTKVLCPKCNHADIKYRIGTESYFCRYCGTVTPKKQMIIREV